MPPTDHDLVFFQGNTYLYWPPFPAIVMMPFVALVGLHFSDVFLVMMIGAFNVSLMALLLRAVNQRGLIPLSAVKRAWLVIFFMAGTVHTTLALTGNVWSASQVISIAGLLVAYCAAVGLKGWKAYLFAGIGMAAAMSTRYTLILAGIWPAWYLINPSCYQRKLIEAARTNKATLSSNPRAVTAWIDFGNNRSIRLPVVSTILRTEACK